jgi:hypothetical protein
MKHSPEVPQPIVFWQGYTREITPVRLHKSHFFRHFYALVKHSPEVPQPVIFWQGTWLVKPQVHSKVKVLNSMEAKGRKNLNSLLS